MRQSVEIQSQTPFIQKLQVIIHIYVNGRPVSLSPNKQQNIIQRLDHTMHVYWKQMWIVFPLPTQREPNLSIPKSPSVSLSFTEAHHRFYCALICWIIFFSGISVRVSVVVFDISFMVIV